jgi:hypothetical protein
VRLDHVARIIVNPDDARHDRLRNNCDARRVGYGAAVKYWEIIIENLRNAGWNCGCISSTDRNGRQFWVVAAERLTLDALLCMQIKSCLPFSNSNRQLKTHRHNHACRASRGPKPDAELGDYR